MRTIAGYDASRIGKNWWNIEEIGCRDVAASGKMKTFWLEWKSDISNFWGATRIWEGLKGLVFECGTGAKKLYIYIKYSIFGERCFIEMLRIYLRFCDEFPRIWGIFNIYAYARIYAHKKRPIAHMPPFALSTYAKLRGSSNLRIIIIYFLNFCLQ